MSEIEKLAPSEYGETERYHWADRGQSCDVYFELLKVPDEWVETLWELYDESLHMEDAVQEQSCYTRDTFFTAMSDPDYSKTVLTIDGIPSGLVLATNNLEKASVTYINPAYIRRRFPVEVEENRFWYITSIFVSPEVRNLGFIKLLGRAPIVAARERDYVIGCDLSDGRLFLLDTLVNIAREVDLFLEKELLGTQSYYILREAPQDEPRKTVL